MDDVVVARVGKPHGLKGEVTVRVHTDAPKDRFAAGTVLRTDPDERGPLTVRTARMHRGIWLLGFEGATDRDAAEALRGTKLLAAPDTDDDDDAWYEEELVGLRVVTVDGREVGTVAGLQDRPAQDLLELSLPDGATAYVPLVEEIVPEIDLEAGRVVIDPPPGLLELGKA